MRLITPHGYWFMDAHIRGDLKGSTVATLRYFFVYTKRNLKNKLIESHATENATIVRVVSNAMIKTMVKTNFPLPNAQLINVNIHLYYAYTFVRNFLFETRVRTKSVEMSTHLCTSRSIIIIIIILFYCHPSTTMDGSNGSICITTIHVLPAATFALVINTRW